MSGDWKYFLILSNPLPNWLAIAIEYMVEISPVDNHRKTNLFLYILALFIGLIGILWFLTLRLNQVQPPNLQLNKIGISQDKKSILNVETKEVIFTIEDTKKYLKDSGYEYNPDTFQTTNAEYAGDCFEEAVLSNNKDKIVFSTSCISGDLPQAWVGVYNLPSYSCRKMVDGEKVCSRWPAELIKFLIGGSGRNFVWSPDDKTIAYEADLGLSGMTETRTIDSRTGEILETKPLDGGFWNSGNADNSDWNVYSNPQTNFTFKYPKDWQVKDYEYKSAACQANSDCTGIWVIELKKPEDTKTLIAINLPQCSGFKNDDLLGNNWICLFEENNETLEIYENIKKSFQSLNISDWKTYRNENYGYEIKYPGTWLFNDFSEKISDEITLSDVRFSSQEENGGEVIISVYDNSSKKLSPEDWLNFYTIEYNDCLVNSEEKTSIVGIEGIKAVLACGDVITENIFLTRDDKIYDIEFLLFVTESPIEGYEEIYEQMLSTFKFAQ